MSEYEAFANMVHHEVLRVLHRNSRRSAVVVDGYDPKTHAAKHRLMPDSVDANNPVLTGWLPLNTMQTGNGFGWHMPPNIGDHGWVEFHDSDREAGTFVGASFNDKFKPVEVKAGEWFYKNKWGTSINFKDDGSAVITDKSGSTIIFDGKGNATVKGNAGNEVTLKDSGQINVKPKDGKFVFLGGDGLTGTYDFVLTSAGPSINVKARIG